MLAASIGDNEQQRLAELASFDLARIAEDSLLNEILALAASVCAQGAAFVHIIEKDSQRCLLAWGGKPLRRVERSESFCGHVVANSQPVVVQDTWLDERFRDNPLVTGGPRIRFYAGAPITIADGLSLGALCVIDSQPAALDERQRDQLVRLARLVGGIFLSHRRQSQEDREAVDALGTARRNYEMLARSNSAIIHAINRDQLFQRICELTLDSRLCGVAWIGWVEKDAGGLREIAVQAAAGLSIAAIARNGYRFDNEDARGNSAAMRSVLLGRPMFDDGYGAGDEAGMRGRIAGHGLRATAAFPLRCGGRIVGVYALGDADARRFDESMVRLLQEIADNVSSFLEQERSAAERSQALQTLQLHRAAMAASSDGILICDARASDLPLVYANPAFESMTGYTVAEALGRNCRFLQGGDCEQPGLTEIRAALQEGRAGEAIVRNYRKDGSLFWNNLRISPVLDGSGSVTHFVGSQNDVSERVRIEQEVAHRATHDPLTGLPNRQLLADRLDHAIAKARRGDELIGVGFIDLDNFKIINDSIGHTAGDIVLRTIAERLKDVVREGDTVGRMGSDEFVLLVEGIESEERLREVAGRILAAIASPIALDGKEYVASASMGLALFPRDGRASAELIKHADFAMYQAKQDGRGVVRTYRADQAVLGADRLGLEQSLRRALARREFRLEYQPKCHAGNGQVSGVEALLRWHHPQRGLVPPLEFIGLTEQMGVIVSLGEWVLEEACLQNVRLRALGLPEFAVAVNVSGIQFKQPDFVDRLREILERTGLPASGLALEITESVTMTDPEHFTKVLRGVKALGIRVALDDFGTGYSSLSYLKRYPIDQVKIDRSFVRDISTDPADAAICGAIIAMAHQLGMEVVAEGVETQQQADFLRARQCDELQGYLLGRPMTGPALEQWLASHGRRGAQPHCRT